MKTIAKAFVELAKCATLAAYEDPDDEQMAEQVVVWCLCESSREEKGLLCEAAAEEMAEARSQHCSDAADFYEKFITRVKSEDEADII